MAKASAALDALKKKYGLEDEDEKEKQKSETKRETTTTTNHNATTAKQTSGSASSPKTALEELKKKYGVTGEKQESPKPTTTNNASEAVSKPTENNVQKKSGLDTYGKNFMYGAERAGAALAGAAENVFDYLGSGTYKVLEGITSLGGLAKNPVSNFLGEQADSYFQQSWSQDWEDSIRERYNPDDRSETITGVGQTVVQMLPAIAAGNAYGAAAKGVKTATDMAKIARDAQTVSKIVFGVQAAGAGANEAKREGASTSKALAYGTASGAMETMIEGVAGGIPGFGNGKLTAIAKKIVDNPIVNKTLDIMGEGAEEAASAIITPFIKRAIYDPNAQLATADEIAESAVLGMISAGVLQAGIELPTAISVARENAQARKETQAKTRSRLEEAINVAQGRAEDPSIEEDLGSILEQLARERVDEQQTAAMPEEAGIRPTEDAVRTANESVGNREIPQYEPNFGKETLEPNAQEIVQPTEKRTYPAMPTEATESHADVIERRMDKSLTERKTTQQTAEFGQETASSNENAATVSDNVTARRTVPYSRPQTQTAAQQMVSETGGYDAHGARTFQSLLETTNADPEQLRAAFQTPYETGRKGIDLTGKYVGNPLQVEAYNAGRLDFLADQNRQATTVTAGSRSGFDATNAPKDVTKTQVKILDTLYKAVGVHGSMVGDAEYNAKITGSEIKMSSTFQRTMGGKPVTIVTHGVHEAGIHRVMKLAPQETMAFVTAMYDYMGRDMPSTVATLAQQKQDFYASKGKYITTSESMEEVVANAVMDLYDDEKSFQKAVQRIVNGNNAEAKRGLARFKEWLDEVREKIRAFMSKLTGKERAEAQEALNEVDRLRAMYEGALSAAVAKNRELEKTNNATNMQDGAVEVAKDGTRHSIKSMNYDIVDGKMFRDLQQYCGMTSAEVEEMKKNLSDLVAYMTPMRDIVDMNETSGRDNRRFSPYKPNSDPLYKISLDFSTMCSKRLVTQYVIEQLQLREDRPMSAEEQMAIRDMLIEYRKQDKALQVACAMCYVEAARLRSPKQMERWMKDPTPFLTKYFAKKSEDFKNTIKTETERFKESRGYNKDATKAEMKASDRNALDKMLDKMRREYTPNAEEQAIIDRAVGLPNATYLTSGNLANLSESEPVIYDAYTQFIRSATRSKPLEEDVAYYYGDSTRDNGNGIVVTDNFIDSVNAENGMRASSWSDWNIKHLLDWITATIDLSVRGSAMHTYTKFPDEVRVLGKTGIMFNMSGVLQGKTGLKADGSLDFSPTESIDYDEAIKLREEFPDTAGLQCIGVSDESIKALLRSDLIDYVIPYHTSGMSRTLRQMAGIEGWANYEGTQSAKKAGKVSRDACKDPDNWHVEPVFSEFFDGGKDGETGIETMRRCADKYKQMCKDRDLIPKFEAFANEPNYWKLLIDRKMINQKTGEIIEQQPVKPNFDFSKKGAIYGVINKYVDNFDASREQKALSYVVEHWDEMGDRIKDLKKGKTAAKKAVDTLANETLAAAPKEIKTTKDSVTDEGNTQFSLIEDEDTLDYLNNQKWVKVYRAMYEDETGLYPPMGAVQGGKRVEPLKLHEWYQADEHPELIKFEIPKRFLRGELNNKGKPRSSNRFMTEEEKEKNRKVLYETQDPNGVITLASGNKLTFKDLLPKFELKKADGGTDVPAAYNPYFHTSQSALNDQFDTAYKRPGMVVVEGFIPESELSSGYKAAYAKDSVGETTWKSGVVAAQLKGEKARRVYLSRYFRAERVVDDTESAKIIAKVMEGENVKIPWNVVTPKLRNALEAQGVEIDYDRVYAGTSFEDFQNENSQFSMKEDDDAYDDEERLNELRAQREDILEELDDPFADLSDSEERKLQNQLAKIDHEIDKMVEKERKASVRTSIKNILDNLSDYRRSDLESLAEQVSEGNWDDYEELSRSELEDGLREMLTEIADEMTPMEVQAPKYGYYVRPVKYSLKEENKLQRENEKLKAVNAALKEQFKLTKVAKVDKKSLDTFTKKLLKDYESGSDITETREKLDELFTYIANGEDGQPPVWEDAFDKAYEVAQDIISNAVTVDDEMYRTYKTLRDTVRTTGITLSREYESDLQGYESLQEFRKANFGRIKLVNDGVPVDTFYQELVNTYSEFFSEDVTHPADQLVRITEVLDELQPMEVNPFEHDMRNMSTWLAGDIIERFYDLPQAKPTYADKAQQKVVKQAIKDGKKIERISEKNRERVKTLIEKNREKLKTVRESERKKRVEAVAKTKEHYKAKEAKASESRKAQILRAKIMRHAQEMSAKLLRPSDKQHVPQNLQGAVARLLEAINLESNRTYDVETRSYKKNDEGLPTARTKAFAEIRKLYTEMAESLTVDPDMAAWLDDIATYADTRIADMTSTELETIWNALRAVEAMVFTANKMFNNARWETIHDAASELQQDNKGKKEKKEFKKSLGKLQQLTGLDMMTPEAYFHRLGKTGDAIFRMMRDAQDKHVSMMKQVSDFTKKATKRVNVTRLEKKLHKVTLGGEQVKLSTAQLMELYVLMRRPQAQEHILIGGVLPESVDGRGLRKVSRAEPARGITMGEVSNAVAKLTKEEIALAEKLQEYASTTLGKWGNEAAMKVYNYEKFNEPTYWPIRTNKQELKSTVESDSSVPSIANKGMTKATKPHANTSVYIGSIFDTFASHSSEMATYAAWLDVSEDVNRIRNYTFRDESGARTGTVKGIIQTVHGERGIAYLQKLLSDVANGVKGSDASFTGGLVGNYKAAAIGGNLRVIIQQPTAILRALDVIGPQYLISGLKPSNGWKKAKQYAPIAQWKDWGYFDIHTGRQMKDVLFETDSALDKVKQASMWGAGAMDSLSWGILWNAVETETAHKHKDLKKGTKEFYEETAKRFNEVIDRTQVVDGILQRSQIMRSADGLAKMATSFMGEPTKQYNMFMTAAYDAMHGTKAQGNGHRRSLARSLVSLAIAGTANAMAQTIIDALRDDDKEKKYWEKWMNQFLGLTGEEETKEEEVKSIVMNGNLANAFNPAGYIPYIKDVWSLIQGYDVARMDMESFAGVIKESTNLMKALSGESKYTKAGAFASFFAEAAKFLGLPVANLKREVKSYVMTSAIETDNYLLQYRLEKASLELNYSGNSGTFMNILYTAYKKDPEAYKLIYDDMVASGYDTEKLANAMESRMKKDQGAESVEDLEQRFLHPDEQTEWDSKMKTLKANSVWKSATAKDREKTETRLYNLVTDNKSSEDMQTFIRGGAKYGLDEMDYLLYKMALDTVDKPSDSGKYGSYTNAENAQAIMSISGLSDMEKAYLYDTDDGWDVYDAGLDIDNYLDRIAYGGSVDVDKLIEAHDAGIDEDTYFDFRDTLKEYDQPTESGNYGSFTQAEATAAIEAMDGLTNEERAWLWQSVNKGWKTKNNPWGKYLP